MKRTLLTLLAASAVAAVALPAAAQPGGWLSINQRQANLEQRIDMGVRNGSLTRQEAARLRAEFQEIARLEARYRRDGLSAAERADLDRRFDILSARIRFERNDRDNRFDRWWDRGPNGPWMNINARQAELDRRIDRGVRDGSLSRREAARLRAEFQEIARLEARYRRDGLSARERADLDARFDRLARQIRIERNDRDNRRF